MISLSQACHLLHVLLNGGLHVQRDSFIGSPLQLSLKLLCQVYTNVRDTCLCRSVVSISLSVWTGVKLLSNNTELQFGAPHYRPMLPFLKNFNWRYHWLYVDMNLTFKLPHRQSIFPVFQDTPHICPSILRNNKPFRYKKRSFASMSS